MLHRRITIGLGMLSLFSAPAAFAHYAQGYTITETEQTESAAPVEHTERDTAPSADDSMKMTDIELTGGATVSRIEFTASVIEKLYTQVELDRCFWDIASSLPPRFTLVFTDVHVSDRYAKHVCIAMRDGIVKGYSDGSFRPERPINLAESAKILSRAFVLAPYADADRLSPWYRSHVEALALRNAIPENIGRMDQLLTPLDAAEMLVRTAEGITWRPSRTYNDLLPVVTRRPAATQKPAPSSASSARSSSSASSSVQSNTVSSARSVTSSAVSSVADSSAVSETSSRGSFWNPF